MADQLGEDLYPNDGAVFLMPAEPPEQAADRAKERAKTRNALPLIKELIVRWENRIKYYETINSIPYDDRKDPKKFMMAVTANQQTIDNLKEEKDYLVQLRDGYGQ